MMNDERRTNGAHRTRTMTHDIILGIDLGTTNSEVAGHRWRRGPGSGRRWRADRSLRRRPRPGQPRPGRHPGPESIPPVPRPDRQVGQTPDGFCRTDCAGPAQLFPAGNLSPDPARPEDPRRDRTGPARIAGGDHRTGPISPTPNARPPATLGVSPAWRSSVS